MPKKTAAAKKRKTQSKADFVRSQPKDTPGKEVVAKAKAAGMTLNEGYVYKIRTLDNKATKKKAAKKTKGTAPRATSTSPKSRGKAPDKKNRVLELVAANPTWGADKVAKAAGCSTTYVYSVWRSKDAIKPKKGNGGATAALPIGNGATTEFYRAVKKIGGVSQAKALLATIEAYENA